MSEPFILAVRKEYESLPFMGTLWKVFSGEVTLVVALEICPVTKQVECDLCGTRDRLTRLDPDDYDGSEAALGTILVCGGCFAVLTGGMAVCEDYCSLHIEHDGVCE